MADNPLEAALRKVKLSRGHLPAKADEKTGQSEKTEEQEEPKRYKVRCTHCNKLMDLTDNDLLSYRTDDETSETGDDDSTDDDDDLTEEEREEYAKDRKSALAAAIAKAAKRSADKTGSNELDSKVAALKQKYSDRLLDIPEQIMIKRGIDPVED
jgi:hypothetical protein